MRLPDISKTGLKIRIKYLSMINHMARIDGHLSKEELLLLQKMVNNFQIPEKHHSKIFDSSKLEQEEIKSLFLELKEKKMEYSFFIDLISMSVVDGIVMDSERAMLADILRMTTISLEEFHNLINFSQVTAKISKEELFDPMYSFTISMIFQWVKVKKIRLYKQTTLSISEALDLHLKTKLQKSKF